jgi:hypothetical protein
LAHFGATMELDDVRVCTSLLHFHISV